MLVGMFPLSWMEKEVREIARFPWACAEPPRTPSSGVSPVMFIPRESRNFPDLLVLVRRTETTQHYTHQNHTRTSYETDEKSLFEEVIMPLMEKPFEHWRFIQNTYGSVHHKIDGLAGKRRDSRGRRSEARPRKALPEEAGQFLRRKASRFSANPSPPYLNGPKVS